MSSKKRSSRAVGTAARPPREIRVRMTSPRVHAGVQPERWVVNGRVIRFLDPCAPEDGWAAAVQPRRVGRIGALLGVLRHPRRRAASAG